MASDRKTWRIVWLVAGLSSVLAAATAVAGDPSNMAERVDMWEQAFNSGDAEAVAAMYAEDGTRLPYQAAPLSGREAIITNIEETRAQGIVKVDLELVASESQGSIGWAHGTYVLMTADGAKTQEGKWMNVSKKVGGEWLIQADIWNTNAPE